MIKAVIFDLDGVLRDAEWVNVESAEKTLKQLGINIDKEDKNIIAGRHPEDYVPLLQGKYNIDKEKYKKIKMKTYFNLLGKSNLFPYALQLLEILKNNFKIALVTSSPAEGAYDFFINKYKLEDTFDAVVTFEDVENRKPAPDCYLQALKKLNLNAEQCVVIEDTALGVEAAKKAGIKCIAVPNKWTKDSNFSKADLVLNSLKEVTLELIEDLE